MNTAHLIEQIEAMRNSFIEAYQFLQLNLPESAAMEEIKAARSANRLILELEAELKQQQQLEKKSTNRK